CHPGRHGHGWIDDAATPPHHADNRRLRLRRRSGHTGPPSLDQMLPLIEFRAQADLRTFAALGHFGTSAVTALTAQNTLGVQGIHGVPAQFVAQQLQSVLDDIDVHAIKTGMLFNAEIIDAVAHTLGAHSAQRALPPLVCDPVCVSTSGHSLLEPQAVDVLVSKLFPMTVVLTPNKSEAEVILSRSISSLADIVAAATDLLKLGPQAVLLKGGHFATTTADIESLARAHPEISIGSRSENMRILARPSGDSPLVVDVLCEKDGRTTVFARPRIDSSSTHGTGCTLSAALACFLGSGATVHEAVSRATAFTHLGIATASAIGTGYGPLNHLHSIQRLIIPPRSAADPFPLTRMFISANPRHWSDYVEHSFVQQLGAGSLPRAAFLHFIKYATEWLFGSPLT
ncbi:unnamed protein product, partial [Mycena citricolor]